MRLCSCVLYGHGQGGVATHGGNVTGIVLNADVGRAQACLPLSKWETYSSYPYADATQWDITVSFLKG